MAITTSLSVSKAIWSIYIVVLLTINGSKGAPRPKPSWYISIDQDQPGIFERTSNTNINRCIKQCQTSDDCMLINFNARTNMCYKTHDKGGGSGTYQAKKQRKAGFMCWEKDSSKRQSPTVTTEKKTTETTSVTPETTYVRDDNTQQSTSIKSEIAAQSTSVASETTTRSSFLSYETTTGRAYSKTETGSTSQSTTGLMSKYTGPDTTFSSTRPEITSQRTTVEPEIELSSISSKFCELDPDHEYCDIYCQPPRDFSSIPHYGNLYNVGSKQAYGCYDQNTQQWYKQVMTCTKAGNWTNTENACSYHYPYMIDSRRMMFKFVKVGATKNDAFAKCQTENAYLIRINNREVNRLLRAKFQHDAGEYWSDANKKSYMRWYSTDGQRVPRGGNIWHTHSFNTFLNGIVNHKCAIIDGKWLLEPTSCSKERYFICEMIM